MRDLFSRLEKKKERRLNLLFPFFTRYSLLFLSFFTSLSFILSSFPFIFFILIIFFHPLHPHLFFFYSLKGRLSDFKRKERGKSNQLLSYLHTRCTDIHSSQAQRKGEAQRKKERSTEKERKRNEK